MTEFSVDFNFKPEVLDSANTAEGEVGNILEEIKNELVGSNDLVSEAAGFDTGKLYRSNN